LRDYASNSETAVEFAEAQAALLRYQLAIATLLYPARETPGTSTSLQSGRVAYNPPFTGVRLPDLSHLQSFPVVDNAPALWDSFLSTISPTISSTNSSTIFPSTELNKMSAVKLRGGPAEYWMIDPGKHDGASISKTVKVLQAEIQALNQAFQMESSDATSALSTENSIREGSKTAMDKSFRVLADILGMRA
jgi:hypothetical protein